MPLYDYRCPTCDRIDERASTIAARHDQTCDVCGAHLDKLATVPAAVHDDTIIGGRAQENFGTEVEIFHSKRAEARRAKELGLIPFVRHVGDQGSDKSSKTQRWI